MQTNDGGRSGNGGGNGQQPSGGSRAPSNGEESVGSREKREEVKKGKRKARSPVPVDEQRERNRQRRSAKLARHMASEARAADTLNRIPLEDARRALDETTERAHGASRQWMAQEARLKATMARMSDEEVSESSLDSPVEEEPSEQEAPESPAEPEDETDTRIGTWQEQAARAAVPDAPGNPEDRGEGGSGLARAQKTPEKPARCPEGSDNNMEEVEIPVKPEPAEIVVPAELMRIIEIEESVADKLEVKPEPEETAKIPEKKEKTAGTGPKPGQPISEISDSE
ncbi:hypothetical protein C8F01DRAFT_1332213 [Mycena amicta]|nr:hypothetical protein C8F01DRAFT_1332213 [Mycena amicta]